jgi:hypothetical protein
MKREKEIKIAIKNFSKEMSKKLNLNKNKTHWSNISIYDLFEALQQEIIELKVGIRNHDCQNIIEECADTANYLMMISDNIKNVILKNKE